MTDQDWTGLRAGLMSAEQLAVLADDIASLAQDFIATRDVTSLRIMATNLASMIRLHVPTLAETPPSAAPKKLELRKLDTPENRAFWASVDRAKEEWECSRPDWSRDLEARQKTAKSQPPSAGWQPLNIEQVQLLAWAVTNAHMLARRALAKTTSVYDREKWEHVLRICEKAGARSPGVLRAVWPTEIMDGSVPLPPAPSEAPNK